VDKFVQFLLQETRLYCLSLMCLWHMKLCRVTGGELFEDIVAREFYSEADARPVLTTFSCWMYIVTSSSSSLLLLPLFSIVKNVPIGDVVKMMGGGQFAESKTIRVTSHAVVYRLPCHCPATVIFKHCTQTRRPRSVICLIAKRVC